MTSFEALQNLLADNVHCLKQSFSMAGSELKKRYSGSLLGWGWSIIKPLVFIFIYWFAMSVGIRGGKPIILENGREVSYIVWMIPGVITWFILQETLSVGVTCVRKNDHLVKKMIFPIGTIPTFTVISLYFSHLLMIAFTAIAMIVTGTGLTWYMLQFPLYFSMFFVFNCILANFVSTLGVISRDFEQLVKAVMNVFFWLSPVLWQIENINRPIIKIIIKLNPYTFFITGYRDCFLGQEWFWNHQLSLLYTLAFMFVFALITSRLHNKLSPEFADVL